MFVLGKFGEGIPVSDGDIIIVVCCTGGKVCYTVHADCSVKGGGGVVEVMQSAEEREFSEK